MAAANKNDLISITEKEFAKLDRLLVTIGSAQAVKKYEDATSIKDVVGHRAHWIELFLGWYADGMAGKEVFFPAKGYKWNQLKTYNAKLRADQSKLKWVDAVSLLHVNHERLIKFLKNRTDKTLYHGPMKGAYNDWTPGRWAEAAGASHYRSAAKFIRKCLKDKA